MLSDKFSGSFSNSKSLDDFFLHTDTQKWFEQKERQIWLNCGIEDSHRAKVKTDMLASAVEKARTRWACITAKSQREENFKNKNGVSYVVNTYQNMTEVKPKYERSGGMEPPNRAGEVINRFTERSRQRMMAKARKLNRQKMQKWDSEKQARIRKEQKLPVPYFVTLTYHKNFKDCTAAKKHLNTFCQRWRRISEDFAYFWKMEPQKRGAIHFHLAMFVPDEIDIISKVNRHKLQGQIAMLKQSDKWQYFDRRTAALQLLVGRQWAEVTKEVDGVDVPFTRIDYIRKRKTKTEKTTAAGVDCTEPPKRKNTDIKFLYTSQQVKTKCANPRLEYKIVPDIDHELYGTNVRKCENWKAFIGYVGKYMKKRISEKNPLANPTVHGTLERKNCMEKPPFRYSSGVPYGIRNRQIKVTRNKTGRFWGYSYNLDFQALQTGIVDHEDLENLNDFCNMLNVRAFATLTDHLIEQAKRIKENYTGYKRKQKLKRCRQTYENQKRRFEINKQKIKQGYMLQWEIPADSALEYRYLLKEKRIDEIFGEIRKAYYNELSVNNFN